MTKEGPAPPIAKTVESAAKKRYLLLFVAGVSLVAAFNLFRYVRPFYPDSWASVAQIPETFGILTDEQKIICSLGEKCSLNGKILALTDAELLAKNPIRIADLRTVAGTNIHLSVLFVRFREDAIEPAAAWTRLISQIGTESNTARAANNLNASDPTESPARPVVLIVNSVDQEESRNDTGTHNLARSLQQACGPWTPYTQSLNLGEISVHPCVGQAYKNLHVGWVSNHAAVIWKDLKTFKAPCWQIQQERASDAYRDLSRDPEYQTCMEQAAGSTVKELFSYLREHPEVAPDAIILNGVGTGVGKLSKERWYPEVTTQLLASIQDSAHAANIPADIFFAVYMSANANDEPAIDDESWLEERTAIASYVGALVRDWKLTNHDVPKSVEATTLLIPALTALAAISLALFLVYPKLPASNPLGISLTKTFLETAGLMSIYVAIFHGLGERRSVVYDLIFASVALSVAGAFFLRENLRKKA